VESSVASVRLRTDAAKRFKKLANATARDLAPAARAESRFRKLNAPHLVDPDNDQWP
jgi:hypothetical protein